MLISIAVSEANGRTDVIGPDKRAEFVQYGPYTALHLVALSSSFARPELLTVSVKRRDYDRSASCQLGFLPAFTCLWQPRSRG
jgi:hypothetical protein